MKLYHDYKKQFKIVLIVFLGILTIFPAVFSYAQTAEDLNNKINQKSTDITRLEEEIKQYQIQLDGLGKQKNSLNVSLAQLDLTRKKFIADISITQNKIDKTNLKIQELSLNINDKQESISNNKDVIALEIRKINEIESSDALAILLSESDFTSIWNNLDNITTINSKLRETSNKLVQAKTRLENIRTETTAAKNELVILKSKLADQKKIIDQNTTEKKKLLAQTKNNESSYQKLLKDRLAKKDAFEKELAAFESQLKYILDPSKLPNKGVLDWPLDYVYITNPFGKNASGLYASGFHNGTDFRSAVGTPLKSMANGIVAGIGNTDTQCPGVSFGRFVLIKYDNGLASTYGHMSLIKVSTGDRVYAGQIVGYTGNTGYSTGPHLHLSVYAKDAVDLKTLPSKSCPGRVLTQPISPVNAYLDPMYYLPPYKK